MRYCRAPESRFSGFNEGKSVPTQLQSSWCQRHVAILPWSSVTTLLHVRVSLLSFYFLLWCIMPPKISDTFSIDSNFVHHYISAWRFSIHLAWWTRRSVVYSFNRPRFTFASDWLFDRNSSIFPYFHFHAIRVYSRTLHTRHIYICHCLGIYYKWACTLRIWRYQTTFLCKVWREYIKLYNMRFIRIVRIF